MIICIFFNSTGLPVASGVTSFVIIFISPRANLEAIKNLPESSETLMSAGCEEPKPREIPSDDFISPFFNVIVSVDIIFLVTKNETTGSPSASSVITSEAFGIILARTRS